MSGPIFDHGQWRSDATVDEIVAEVTTDPRWDFEASPISFIAYCSGMSVYAYAPPSRQEFWKQVGRRLCEIAGIPYGLFLE
jgi:hypothetical protein